jgi:hypothetical protein
LNAISRIFRASAIVLAIDFDFYSYRFSLFELPSLLFFTDTVKQALSSIASRLVLFRRFSKIISPKSKALRQMTQKTKSEHEIGLSGPFSFGVRGSIK